MGNIVFTGGSGLLGREIQSQNLFPTAFFPTSNELDVSQEETVLSYFDSMKDAGVDTLVHMAAFTSPPRINADPMRALTVNIIGTANIVKICGLKNFRLIYLCTDYVFKGDKGKYKEEDPVYPLNKYAWSKLGGECAVRLYDNSLIIRLSFGEKEFPFEKAFVDQWTSRITVDVAARKIASLINCKELFGTIHIGSERQTVYDYATSVSPDKMIGELKRADIKNMTVPKDVSLDTTKYDNLRLKGEAK